MKLTEKLDLLLSERNLSKHQFAIQSGIPYTTVDGFYKKGTDGTKLSTLLRLSDFFDLSIDYFADDNIVDPIPKGAQTPLSALENQIIKKYRTLDGHGKTIVDFILKEEAARSEAQRKESEFIPVMMVARNGERGIVMASKDTMKDAEFSDTGDL